MLCLRLFPMKRMYIQQSTDNNLRHYYIQTTNLIITYIKIKLARFSYSHKMTYIIFGSWPTSIYKHMILLYK